MNAHSSPVPLWHALHDLPPVPLGSLPDVSDDNMKVNFQCLMGPLLYLVICTCPDIFYATMALGHFNSNSTEAHFLAVKGVLCYLLGTLDFALEYNLDRASISNPISLVFPTNCSFSNAAWTSDKLTHQSVSDYAFYFIVAWYFGLPFHNVQSHCLLPRQSTWPSHMSLKMAFGYVFSLLSLVFLYCLPFLFFATTRVLSTLQTQKPCTRSPNTSTFAITS
jgi:hypothetical protein